MKAEAIKVKEKVFYFIKSYPLKLIFIRFMCFIAGMITSKGNILGGCYPFGISFSASVPGKFVASTMAGALAGYFFPFNFGVGIRYISTVISIAAVRWTLSDFTKIKNHFLYIPMTVFCSSLVTGLAVDSAEGFTVRGVLISVFESLIAAGAACFFEKAFKILSHKKIKDLTTKEFIIIVLSLNIVLFSVSSFSPFGISVGRVFAILLILISSLAFNAEGGCIAGIASGVVFGFSSFGAGNMSMLYAFGGMMAGILSSFGKGAIAFGFIFSELLVSFSVGDGERIVLGMYETVIAAVIYLMIPNGFLDRFKKSCSEFTEAKESANPIIAQKLHFASKSVSAVPAYMEKAFWDVFKPENNPLNFKTGCVHAIYMACKSCKKAPYCWGERAKYTSDFFGNIVSSKNKFDLATDAFGFCENKLAITKGIKENYNKFLHQNNAKAIFGKFKKSISEQVGAISSVMEGFAERSYKNLTVKGSVCDALENELLKMHIPVLRLVCYQNEQGMLFVDIECDSTFANKFSEKVVEKMSEICERKLDFPIINNYGTTSRIQFCEAKKFGVDFGFTQHAFEGGMVCGDSFCKFEDGEGNFNVIISDGMGTGDSAAIQGNITSELMKNFVKSGIDMKTAIKFVNSALLLNAGEEALSTLDIISINLFDGNAKFAKAGAPPTFVVRNEEIIKICAESLPIGILSDAEIAFKNAKLNSEDYVIMFSDGVTDIGEEWIYDIIKSKNYENAKELSKRIVKKAVCMRKENNHDDDITCIVMKLAC